MNKNKGARTHAPELYDYRRAKLLLDIIAGYPINSLEMKAALAFLIIEWGLSEDISKDFKPTDELEFIQVLAQFVLKHGKAEHQKRIEKIESED